MKLKALGDILEQEFLSKFSTSISTSTIIITLLFAFLLSIFIYFIYKLTSKGVIYSKRFNITMSVLGIISAAIVLGLQSSITLSLGTIGALFMVRFRTSIKEPRDLMFIFWSLSNGIIVGSGMYILAVILDIIVSIALLFYDLIPEKKLPYLLVIYFKNVKTRDIEIIFGSYKVKYKLKSENLSSKESSYIYEVKVKNNKDFIDEILKIKGINEVNLISQDGESQY